jgi:dATP pyrophosphohydrolase
MTSRFKIPRSVLVVIYTADLLVLMLERAGWPGFWQSVTGSIEHDDEPLIETAAREVREETGIDASHYRLQDWEIENRFEIFMKHRSRYADGVTHNEEHVFGLELPVIVPVRLEPTEHLRYEWLPWKEAAERTLSWTNRDAILLLPQKRGAGAF